MLHQKNNISIFCCFVVISALLSACTKQSIQFGSETSAGDPNITLIDTFTVSVSTLQLDSFSTKNSNYFIAGAHHDPELGYIESKAFFEIAPPSLNLSSCNNCVFDSIELHTKISSGYMGDTSVPFTLNVHEVTEAMNESEIPLGYNVNTVDYNRIPMASRTMIIRPSSKDDVKIRLPDAFGKTLFRMLKTNSDTLTNIDIFKSFFKGICLASGTSNNAIYYFDKNADSGAVIQLHYTIAGGTPQSETTNFSITSTSYNFNSFTYNRAGTPLSVFTPGTEQLINSTATNNIAYMHYNSGLFPKISFGNLFSIKELHPFVQVLKAELQVSPVNLSYGRNTFYGLPPSLEALLTDDNNYVTGSPLVYTASNALSQIQYGNLFIDNLYGETTSYTYDVTSFVNTILQEGVFSRRALILYPLSTDAASTDERLLVNNGVSVKNNNPMKLKLYILGL